MKINYTVIFLLLFLQNSSGQIYFQKQIIDQALQLELQGNSIESISNGDLILCTSGVNYVDYSTINGGLFCLDSTAALKWGKIYKPLIGTVSFMDAVEADNKSIIVIGSYKKDAFQSSEAYVMKSDSAGNFLWGMHFADSQSDSTKGLNIIRTTDGHFILAVANYHSGGISHSSSLLKINSSGNIIWQKKQGLPTCEMVALANGEFACNGQFINCLAAIRYDSTGNSKWTRYIIFNNNSIGDYLPVTIGLTPDSILLFAGNQYDVSGAFGIAIFRVDLSGNIVSQCKLSQFGNQRINKIKALSDGSVIVTQNAIPFFTTPNSSQSILLFDSTLTPVNYLPPGPTAEYISDVIEQSDGSLIFTGQNYYATTSTMGLQIIKVDRSLNYGCSVSSVAIADTFSYNINVVTSGTQNASLLIDTMSVFVVQSTFTVNVNCFTTDIENNSGEKLNIYPNPAAGNNIRIDNVKSENCLVTLLDITGKEIFRKYTTTSGNSILLETKNLNTGLYFIVCYDGKNNYRSKIIVQ